MVFGQARHLLAGAGLLCGVVLTSSGQGIYSCVDGQGRTITADRPIPNCADRVQRELNPSGTVRRKVDPAFTAEERAQIEAKERQAAEANAKLLETRRRDRLLLIRYPNPQAHERERANALAQIDEVIQAARKRMGELAQQRQATDAEMEFYLKDPSKAPETLKRQRADIEASSAIQQRFIADQEADKKRASQRFDDELARLKPLWNGAAP